MLILWVLRECDAFLVVISVLLLTTKLLKSSSTSGKRAQCLELRHWQSHITWPSSWWVWIRFLRSFLSNNLHNPASWIRFASNQFFCLQRTTLDYWAWCCCCTVARLLDRTMFTRWIWTFHSSRSSGVRSNRGHGSQMHPQNGSIATVFDSISTDFDSISSWFVINVI